MELFKRGSICTESVQKDEKFGAINAEQKDTCKETAFKITAEGIQKTDAIQEMQWEFKITYSRSWKTTIQKLFDSVW